jgi:hypothetical protein
MNTFSIAGPLARGTTKGPHKRKDEGVKYQVPAMVQTVPDTPGLYSVSVMQPPPPE